MGDTNITYGAFGMENFKQEICSALGDAFWDELTTGDELPDITLECGRQCAAMARFMRKLERMADAETVKNILYRVRHGLHPSQVKGAREAFLETGDLDAFIEQHLQEQIAMFERLNAEGKDFYGQEITDEALAFVKAHPTMLAPIRQGRTLHVTAFPCNIKEYLRADDDRMRRYQACHCPFAKESILADETVSATLCNCSLGHVTNFIEAFLDRPLEGKVVSSVLAGDLLCEYEIAIPDDIMAAYVKNGANG